MYKITREYKRTTQSTAFSLPLALIEDLNKALAIDLKFRNRSELATKLLSDYVEEVFKKAGVKNESDNSQREFNQRA